MLRAFMVAAVSLLLMTACDRAPQSTTISEADVSGPATEAAPEPKQADATTPGGGDIFAYSHSLSLGMASANVGTRFDLARERCLKDPAFGCELLASSINMGDEHTETAPRAHNSR